MNHQIRSFVVGVASLMAVVLCAQTRPPQRQQPVFKSAANHVLVDVIATDKNDKPVISCGSRSIGTESHAHPGKTL